MASEEGLGLLSGVHDSSSKYSEPNQTWTRRKVVASMLLFIFFLVSGASIRSFYFRPDFASSSHNYWSSGKGDTRSNGTHEFKRTVVLVSIDGLRADYLDRGLTPHILGISKNGLRAKSMRPIFPTITFPNHWALMTGLYAESHGIVANNFWDPETGREFHYNRFEASWQPDWWLGEPMWETAGRAGLITANLMWPGPPKTSSGATPTYFVPWKDHVSLEEKHDQIMKWIDLPINGRPQLILAYEPSLDQAGHLAGPMSTLVNETLGKVDEFAKRLHTSLKDRNLEDIVDIIFVSDHGMTDTSHPEPVYIDDFIGEDGVKMIEHEDGSPSMGLRFKESANASRYLHALEKAADNNQEKFAVYTHETMPKRYHFSNNIRIAPIYIIPKIGYALTTRADGKDNLMSKGNHGYDNEDESMHAIFVAHGPFTSDMKAFHQSRSRLCDDWHSTGENSYILERFQNVEIYNLVLKLLGIAPYAAATNGTIGFWDKYL